MRKRLLSALPIPVLLFAVAACRDASTTPTAPENGLPPSWTAAILSAPEAVAFDPTVKEMIDQVSSGTLLDGMEKLTGREEVIVGGNPYTISTRYTRSGTPIEMATQYAFERFQAAGLAVDYHDWTRRPFSGRNVVAEKTGTQWPSEILLVTAHIDDVPSRGPAPGADDDGTGSEAVMTVAELMASRNFERTVRFVLFTGEEQGLLGSWAYASSIAGQDVVGVLNLEMLGWNSESDPEPTMRIYTRSETSPSYQADIVLAEAMEGVISAYVLDLVPLVTPSGRTDSDHASFWDQGMAAVVAAQDAEDDFNPYYHTSEDDVDKLDMEYFTNLVKAVVGTAAHLAVPSAATDPPPEPTATLTASPSEIAQGGTAILSWATTNATTVTISELGAVGLNGSKEVSPSVTTTYELTATGDGGTATATAVVTVTAAPPPEPDSETEPNDSKADADLVLISGTTMTGTVASATDSDYFSLSLPGGATLVADLIVPADKNYDLRIYRSVGSTLARGTNPTGEPEHVTYVNTGSSSMTVYVRVYGSKRVDWGPEEYQLTLTW